MEFVQLEEEKQGSPPNNYERDHLKFDVGANRFDLACAEGLSNALRVFEGRSPPLNFKIKNIRSPKEKLIVKESVLTI